MKDGKKLVYSGDSLRRFLHRKGLTYKDAAKELGLDKIYKNIKNLSTEELALKASKQQEISLLQNLIRNYQDRIDLLQQELGQYKSE